MARYVRYNIRQVPLERREDSRTRLTQYMLGRLDSKVFDFVYKWEFVLK
jgi:hypothetical protein